MPASLQSEESDGFHELAQITLLSLVPPATEGIEKALAHLLRAASLGTGSVPVGALRLTEEDLLRIQELPQLFHTADGRLSLPRYARYEADVVSFFEARLKAPPPQFEDAAVANALNAILPQEEVRDSLGTLLFDNSQQRLAIAGLLDSGIGILTGGPGTGKTTTAAALLAVFRRLNPSLEPAQVLVTAPTGKAACRIGESIRNALPHLHSLTAEEKSFLQSLAAKTLHRALGWSPVAPEEGGPFRHHSRNPLAARIVLVDEASMVDAHLMRALVTALPPEASLFLLGDSDQLESVEVGGILLQLLTRSAPPGPVLLSRLAGRLSVPPETVCSFFAASPTLGSAQTESASDAAKPPLAGLAYSLKFSRRAMRAPWILQLAALVRPSSPASFETVAHCLKQHPGKLHFLERPMDFHRSAFLQEQWREWLERIPFWKTLATDSEEERLAALKYLSRFQFLCSTNAQVERANRLGLHALTPGFRPAPSLVPHGCPILIEKNRPSLGLTNGDVGIAFSGPGESVASLGLFYSPGGVSSVLPLASLPKFSPAFGLTIHKSQGSEWDTVAIELPPEAASGLLTRNLLYTALTRASSQVHLLGDPSVLRVLLARIQSETPPP